MSKIEDIKYRGNPFKQRNRIEEAMSQREISSEQLPVLNKAPIVSPEPVAEKAPSTSRARKLRIINLIALVVGVALLLGGYTIYKYYAKSRSERPEALLGKVGALVTLPIGETPTVATVSDLLPLKGQAFFNDAQLGDKIIVFAKAKKAILYRPSTNKIIIVAPVN